MYADDAAWDTWAAANESNVDADIAQWAAYGSGYVLAFKYAMTGIVDDADFNYNKNNNGWCLRDKRTELMYGGFCVFPLPLIESPDFDSATAETYRLTEQNFVNFSAAWPYLTTPDGSEYHGTLGAGNALGVTVEGSNS